MRSILVAAVLVVSMPTSAFADHSEGYKPAVSTTETTSAAVDPREIVTTKPPPDRVRIDQRLGLEPLVGYGTNDWNFGAGGRVGYTFPALPFYVGGTFVWYSGDTVSDTKTNHYFAGLETGYAIGLARGLVMLRPYLGTAILYTRRRVAVNGQSSAGADDQGMLYPGVAAHLNVPGSPVFVGADNRLLVPLDDGKVSYQVFFTTGLSL